MLSIGHIKFNSPLVLAPMAGISDLPFRMINRPFGCELAFTEMINAGSLVRKNVNTLKNLFTTVDDRPLGVQLLGADPDVIRRAVDIVSGYAFDIIDFNAACPVNKIVSRGEGAGLLLEPLRLQKILKIIVENTDKSVTVKIRSGWDESSVNAPEIALRAQDAGVKALIIHGRTRQQAYRGKVDYETIRKVKESLKIPVIASGDALSPELIRKLFDETGCDGVAVARGALGNPWIFLETEELLKKGSAPLRPSVQEITQTMKKHLDLNISFHGEERGVLRFRKFFGWYTRGMSVKMLKMRAFHAVTGEDMQHLIEEVEEDYVSKSRA
ncbi:MAG: tRNA dihydrouridine synthase DusB [Nitrospirota bacterium]|nr:tRNA dihydrouridine synthase DusB [Nitrospirota bacterium]